MEEARRLRTLRGAAGPASARTTRARGSGAAPADGACAAAPPERAPRSRRGNLEPLAPHLLDRRFEAVAAARRIFLRDGPDGVVVAAAGGRADLGEALRQVPPAPGGDTADALQEEHALIREPEATRRFLGVPLCLSVNLRNTIRSGCSARRDAAVRASQARLSIRSRTLQDRSRENERISAARGSEKPRSSSGR
jgi:hypothetical protein